MSHCIEALGVCILTYGKSNFHAVHLHAKHSRLQAHTSRSIRYYVRWNSCSSNEVSHSVMHVGLHVASMIHRQKPYRALAQARLLRLACPSAPGVCSELCVRGEHSQSERGVRVPRMESEIVNKGEALGQSRGQPSTRKKQKSEQARKPCRAATEQAI
eukprot:3490562-Pleurochrysis_carterae.AAC.1